MRPPLRRIQVSALAGGLAVATAVGVGLSGAATAVAAPGGPSAAASQTAAAPLLRQGMTGPRVSALQRSLHALHYQVRRVTGTFDSETRHAVMAFQKVNGLQRDGVAGPRTMAALRHPVRPAPRRATSGLRIEIDVTRQVAYAIRGGSVARIYNVSTGRPGLATPLGEFSVQRRINGMRHARLGDLWRPVYFVGGVAMHGGQPVPAVPASHGCVRMSDPSINELFGQLTPGTPVAVYRS